MNYLYFLTFLGLIGARLVAPLVVENELPPATPCDEEKCILPNCRCSTNSIPGDLAVNDTPQFVFLTFDDAVNDLNFNYYSQLLFDRINPDGCNVSATAFVTHDYTNYPMVRQLYENGFEIALHSITHYNDYEYWKNASVELLNKEFGGERDLISKFTKIDKDQFLGIRSPYLQLSGNNSFQSIKESNLKYDCSWSSRDFVKPGLWPYTLDYLSVQNCDITPCPNASIPGVWVVPMLDWFDNSNNACSMADSCVDIPTDSAGILEWMQANFHTSYNENKAPFGVYIHYPWA